MHSAIRTALVTGANRGLGFEACHQLAHHGWRVLLTSRSDSGMDAAERLRGEGLDVSWRSLDVADSESRTALANQLRREGIRLDALVLNAGISLDGFDAEVARRTIDVNYFGALHTLDALLPLVPDGGSIVLVSSGLGELACMAPPLRTRFLDPHLTRDGIAQLLHTFVEDVASGRHSEAGWPTSAYRVSKAGMNALVRVLAPELANRRIRLNAVCPGWARTDMGGKDAPRSAQEGAASIVWPVLQGENGPSGGFFRDGAPLEW